VRLLNAKLQAVIDDPKVEAAAARDRAEPLGGPAPAFRRAPARRLSLLGPVVRESGIKME